MRDPMIRGRRVWAPVLVALLLAGGSGCYTPPHPTSGLSIGYWNEGYRNLTIFIRTPGDGYPGGFLNHGPPEKKGGVLFGCDVGPEKAWWLWINLTDTHSGKKWDRYWSDVGCGTVYNFVFHKDDTSTLALVDKNPEITKTDLPRQ